MEGTDRTFSRTFSDSNSLLSQSFCEMLLLTAFRLSCCAILFCLFRPSSACFGGGLGCGGMGPWGEGPGTFGWGGPVGADWSLGHGGYATPFLGAYGAPFTGAYAAGIYAAAPAAAFVGPCCPTTFGDVIGFRRKRRRSDGDKMPTFLHPKDHYQKNGLVFVPSNKNISSQKFVF